jgi:hypothetical protein
LRFIVLEGSGGAFWPAATRGMSASASPLNGQPDPLVP